MATSDLTILLIPPADDAALLTEVRRLTEANTRLTELVRHARGPLHEDGLLTDAEYAALAEDSGAVVRLTTIAQLQGDVARETRAKNVAIGERDEARTALASIPWSRMEAWSHGHKARSVEIECPNGYGAGCWSVTLGHEHGITRAEEVSFWTLPKEKGGEVAYRTEAEKSGVVFAKNIDDGRDWPGMDATVTAALDAFDRGVWGPRDAARLPGDPDPTLQTALATARVEGQQAERARVAAFLGKQAEQAATKGQEVGADAFAWAADRVRDGRNLPVEVVAREARGLNGDVVREWPPEVFASWFGSVTMAIAEAGQAVATARIDGARAMLDKVRERTAALRVTIGAVAESDTCPDVDMDDEIHDLWLTVDQIDALDPAAVVGSGS